MITVEEDRAQAHIHGLLQVLRDAETDFRRSYARMLDVVAELEAEQAGLVTGFGSTARWVARVLNLSTSEAKARVEQAQLLTPRHSLTGEVLPPVLPATTAELSAGAIGPAPAGDHCHPAPDPARNASRGGRAGRADPRQRRKPVRPRRAGPHRRAPAGPPRS